MARQRRSLEGYYAVETGPVNLEAIEKTTGTGTASGAPTWETRSAVVNCDIAMEVEESQRLPKAGWKLVLRIFAI